MFAVNNFLMQYELMVQNIKNSNQLDKTSFVSPDRIW